MEAIQVGCDPRLGPRRRSHGERRRWRPGCGQPDDRSPRVPRALRRPGPPRGNGGQCHRSREARRPGSRHRERSGSRHSTHTRELPRHPSRLARNSSRVTGPGCARAPGGSPLRRSGSSFVLGRRLHGHGIGDVLHTRRSIRDPVAKRLVGLLKEVGCLGQRSAMTPEGSGASRYSIDAGQIHAHGSAARFDLPGHSDRGRLCR